MIIIEQNEFKKQLRKLLGEYPALKTVKSHVFLGSKGKLKIYMFESVDDFAECAGSIIKAYSKNYTDFLERTNAIVQWVTLSMEEARA